MDGRRRPPSDGAEREYAWRAGTTPPFNTGNNLMTSQANYDGNKPYNGHAKGQDWEKTTPVGSFPPNAWDLYDMHGNVVEWCADWYGAYSSGAQTNPKGSASGFYRVLHGGSWLGYASNCRSAFRSNFDPGGDYRYDYLGFRVVRP